ncbi:MAG: ATP-binding protein [Candidatus Methylomirabilales bacterium]
MTTASPAVQKRTALVVDDDRFMRELCADILSQAGFHVQAVADAKAGVDLAQADPPTVILLDVILPTMSGTDALTCFAQVTPHTPVIIITAHASLQTAIDAVKHGAYDYIHKPFDPDALVAAAKRAEERHRLLEENYRLVHTLQEKVEELSRLHQLANELARDLQQRVEARTEELHRSERLTEGIITHMASGLMVSDPSGMITLINPHGAATLRCKANEVLGHKLTDLFPNAGELLEVRGDSGHQELDLTLRDGDTIPLGFSNSYLTDARGDREGVIVVIRDLSEIKELQTELRRKDRFAAIGQVVAGVAHEIRNPLFGITSVAQILKREMDFTPEHRELVEAMLSETRRLNALVSDLLLFGRPSPLEKGPTDLHQLLEASSQLYAGEMHDRSIHLHKAYDPHLPPLLADSDKLKQVILNLLKNALEATPSGGTVTVGTRVHKSEGRGKEDQVEMFVSDTGPGIPPKDQDRIFDLFFTTKPRGAGLGLPICRRIVEDHGGTMTVESQPGQGTTLTVQFPLKSAERLLTPTEK